MAYNFSTSNGDGREYSRESYGTSVSSGGGRRNGMKPGAPTFDPQSFSQASVAQDAPRVPNLTAGAPMDGQGSTPAAGMSMRDYEAQRDAEYFRPLTPDELTRQQAGAEEGRRIDAANQARTRNGSQTGSRASRLEGQVNAYGDMVGQDFKRSVGSMLGDLNGIGALRSGAVTSGMNDLTTNYGRQVGNYAAQTATDAEKLDQQESEFGRGLASQNSQFDRNLAFQREDLNQRGALASADLMQRGSQFDRSFGEQGREFDANMGQQDKEFQTNTSFRQNQANFENADTLYERNFRDRQYADQRNASQKRGVGKLLGGLAGGVGGFMLGGPGGAMAGVKAGSSIFG
jgi:hypothetical protein